MLENRYNRLTKGINLTKRQQQTIKNQIARGVKNPSLTIQGVKLTLPQLKTTQRLIEKDIAQTERKSGRRTGQQDYKRVKGGIITQKGIFISNKEKHDFERQVRNLNAFLSRNQFKETALRVISYENRNVKGTRFYPSRAAEKPFNFKSLNLSRFKTKAEFEEISRYYSTIYDKQTKEGPTLKNIYAIEKENWIRAYNSVLGRFADWEVLDMVNHISDYPFHILTSSGIIKHVGEIYIATDAELIDEAEKMKAALYYGNSERYGGQYIGL